MRQITPSTLTRQAQSLAAKYHSYCAMVTVVLILLIMQLLQQEYGQLAFDRSAIEQGQWWRVISGHLVHSNYTHWLMNLGAWFIVSLFLKEIGFGKQLVLILCLSAGISLMMLLARSELGFYVGFSGVLHGLFLIAAIRDAKKGLVTGYVLGLILIVKVIWQLIFPDSTNPTATAIGLRVAVEVHAYGMLVAIPLTFMLAVKRPRGQNTGNNTA